MSADFLPQARALYRCVRQPGWVAWEALPFATRREWATAIQGADMAARRAASAASEAPPDVGVGVGPKNATGGRTGLRNSRNRASGIPDAGIPFGPAHSAPVARAASPEPRPGDRPLETTCESPEDTARLAPVARARVRGPRPGDRYRAGTGPDPAGTLAASLGVPAT